MFQIKKYKKEAIQWGVLLSVIVILFVTGLHTEISGGIQRIFLATGINRPLTPKPEIDATFLADNEVNSYKYDLPLKTIEGKEFNLKSLKGKVVFMNLWASWCPPCIAEMPGIQKLYDKIDKSKVAFVLISLDEDQRKGKKFIERKNFTFPVFFPENGLPSDFHTTAIPTTFILGPGGSIITRHEGMADFDTEEFREYLISLAKK